MSRTGPADFDTPPERRGGDSTKWNRYAGRDVLPMWVADMDFAAPPAVLAALHARIDHGVFGYSQAWPSLAEAVVEALQRDHAWSIHPDWIVWLPGLVSGLNVACRALAAPGDGVLTATPVYPPFMSAPRFSGRELVEVPLACTNGRWHWDLARAQAAVTPRSRLLLLCNPHNPVGRVFGADELAAIAEFCARHALVLVSDEIHCGLVLDTALRHLPVAALDPQLARRCVTLMAASKTWNLPGLGCAFAVIPDDGLRQRWRRAMRGIVPHVNVLGMVATEAAYRHGGPWRETLLDYLRGNRDLLREEIARLPGLAMSPVEATYLAWIDARASGLADPAGAFEAAGVGLSDGGDYGAPGFVRLNFGCARATLREALVRIERALPG